MSLPISRLSLGFALTLFLGACHTLAPVEPTMVLPGETVRARLSRSGAARLAEVLGRNDPVLEGTVLEHASADVLIEVQVATRQIGFRYEPMGQRVLVGFSEILEMERRELDRWKTTGLIAGLGTVVGVIAWQLLSGESGGSTDNPGGGGVSDAKILRIDFRMGG